MEESAKTAGKKRKIRLEDQSELEAEIETSSVQLQRRRLDVVAAENSASPTNAGNSTCESVSSDHVGSSCCSSNGSSVVVKNSAEFVDLEQTETTIPEFSATSAGGESLDCRKRRETSPSSEVQVESGDLDSTAGPCEFKSFHRREKIPSGANLEEFFSAAENNLQKQFIDKYNYDIVLDQPLEGRYEWVQI